MQTPTLTQVPNCKPNQYPEIRIIPYTNPHSITNLNPTAEHWSGAHIEIKFSPIAAHVKKNSSSCFYPTSCEWFRISVKNTSKLETYLWYPKCSNIRILTIPWRVIKYLRASGSNRADAIPQCSRSVSRRTAVTKFLAQISLASSENSFFI